ncbi:sushi, nidogen and EGF-like domain-containing protein 1 [Ditylenchus destructor]|uniref:Sushi, nidogen and EGF-like domain-containing protein 1 n=1 Tax=Ditylenchus destructor TaxID=166010 RepID=A0AAD4R9G6_9BILA|nr:sushi, nidogen and EGF-like domain-containing protein 1 [Ditylenchus destructor]
MRGSRAQLPSPGHVVIYLGLIYLLSFALNLFNEVRGDRPKNDYTPCNNSIECNGHGDCGSGTTAHYTCICDTGYSGDKCQNGDKDRIPCDRSDCNNHGTCTGTKNHPNCNCEGGWGDDKCKNPPCDNQKQCDGHGQCSGTSENYYCKCDNGFSGNNCKDVDKNVAACDRGDCNHQGNCSGVKNSPTCTCDGGFTGDRCQDKKCDSNKVCNGHGTCSGTEKDWTCQCSDKRWTSKECDECSSGYSGNNCENEDKSKIDCDRSDCNNRGNCSGKKDDPKCSCDSPYSGSRCELSPCNANSMCNGHATKCNGNDQDPKCECSTGYSGSRCENADNNVIPCDRSDCSEHGNCTGVKNAPNCHCDVIRTGNRCEKAYCDRSTTCNGHGHCNDTFNCVCDDGFCGKNCEKSCPSNNTNSGITNPTNGNGNGGSGVVGGGIWGSSTWCTAWDCSYHGTCIGGTKFFPVCQCQFGFTGRRCETNQSDINENSDSSSSSSDNSGPGNSRSDEQCDSSDCSFRGTCIGTKSDFICQCNQGFSGNRCMVAGDSIWGLGGVPCLNAQQPCSGHGVCQPTTGCVCYVGWSSVDCSVSTMPTQIQNTGGVTQQTGSSASSSSNGGFGGFGGLSGLFGSLFGSSDGGGAYGTSFGSGIRLHVHQSFANMFG